MCNKTQVERKSWRFKSFVLKRLNFIECSHLFHNNRTLSWFTKQSKDTWSALLLIYIYFIFILGIISRSKVKRTPRWNQIPVIPRMQEIKKERKNGKRKINSRKATRIPAFAFPKLYLSILLITFGCISNAHHHSAILPLAPPPPPTLSLSWPAHHQQPHHSTITNTTNTTVATTIVNTITLPTSICMTNMHDLPWALPHVLWRTRRPGL